MTIFNTLTINPVCYGMKSTIYAYFLNIEKHIGWISIIFLYFVAVCAT